MSHAILTENFFRLTYAKLVSSLSRRVGGQHLSSVEDAVQFALTTGLETWGVGHTPHDPVAWLYTVAYRRLIDEFRQTSSRSEILERLALDAGESTFTESLSNEMTDDMLLMLFASCDAAIPQESQLVFALKVLGGFSISEVAHRLFISEANAYKRFSRCRDKLSLQSEQGKTWDLFSLKTRLASVEKVLYLLFTEGHLSVNHDFFIRQELCEEAIRLTLLLVNNPVGETPSTYALLALMMFHRARLPCRQSPCGGALLLEQQARELLDQHYVEQGFLWLGKSAHGSTFSRYHAEAAIALEHCVAPSVAKTRWQVVAENYQMLNQVAPSALHHLNHAVAVAQWQGPEAGLRMLKKCVIPSWLSESYLWHAVMADLYLQIVHQQVTEKESVSKKIYENKANADKYKASALKLAPTQAIHDLLIQRFDRSVQAR